MAKSYDIPDDLPRQDRQRRARADRNVRIRAAYWGLRQGGVDQQEAFERIGERWGLSASTIEKVVHGRR